MSDYISGQYLVIINVKPLSLALTNSTTSKFLAGNFLRKIQMVAYEQFHRIVSSRELPVSRSQADNRTKISGI